MKKRSLVIVIIVIILLFLLVPVPRYLNDGGTVEYKALTYKISKVHRLVDNLKTEYEEGTIIEILGMEVFNNVNKKSNDNTNVNANLIDEKKKIEWNEISKNGIDEESLLKNLDTNILETISTEFQTLVNEETEEERTNPEIVITEGWTRVFKSERYKKVLNIGNAAMKPLYLIIYKSPNAGLYEYICANALYELSGYNFEWANSKEFLEKFNEQIIEDRQ